MSALREQINSFLRSRPDLTAEALAAHTGMASQTVRNFLIGQRDETAALRAELAPVLDRARRGEILSPTNGRGALMLTEDPAERVRRVPKRRDFYETQTASRVGQALSYCARRAAIGVITAGYGVGKTTAAQHWRETQGRRTDTLMIEFDAFSGVARVEFVRVLAEALGVPSPGGNANHLGGALMRAIVARLREEPCLLIVDQAEIINVVVGQLVRQIWDRTREAGVGVALLASPLLLRKLHASRVQDLGALTSRVGVWAALSGVTKPEMAAILKQESITEVEESAFDLWFHAVAGSMRALMATIDLIQERHAGKAVTEKTIRGLAAHVWGLELRHAD